MPQVRGADATGDERREDTPGPGPDQMSEIEGALERLFEAGALELPPVELEQPVFEHIQPSHEAKAIGRRVQERVLSRLGRSNLGTYIARERQASGLKRKEVVRRVKLSSELLLQLETNRFEFYRLSPTIAVDLVQLLRLDTQIVVRYLKEASRPEQPYRAPTSFFRIDTEASEEERHDIQRSSEESLASKTSDHPDQLESFLQAFLRELAQRGLLDK